MWTGYEKDRAASAERSGAQCPLWCDTDFTKDGAEDYTAAELVDAIKEVAGDCHFVVLSGGEPLLQVDAHLVAVLRVNYYLAIETNGTQYLGNRSRFDTRIHGLGMTAPWMLARYPYYSVDSTSWL